MIHHRNCNADYPEKVPGEKPQQITRQVFDGFTIDTCVDCGATEDTMPAESDPYWDDAKADLERMTGSPKTKLRRIRESE